MGGLLLLPATPEVIAAFVAEAQAAPEELSTIANIMPAPPLPFVPADHHGRLVIMATLAYAGDVEDGERAVAPFRALATPIADLVRPMPYPDIYPPEQDGFHPTAGSHTMFVDAIDRDGSRRSSSTAGLDRADAGGAAAGAWRGHGPCARPSHRVRPPSQSTHGQRGRGIPASRGGGGTPGLGRPASLRRCQGGDARAYVNFLGDEGEARIREAYPGSTWERLAAVKARYDPTNLFHLNQNIPPTTGHSDGEVSAAWNRDLRAG